MPERKWRFRDDMLCHYVNGTSNLTFQDAENRLNYLEAKEENMQNIENNLYIVRDCDNSFLYIVRAESREKAMDLICNYIGLDKEDLIVDMADNDNGEIIE